MGNGIPIFQIVLVIFRTVTFVNDGFHIIYVGHANPVSTSAEGQINATHT